MELKHRIVLDICYDYATAHSGNFKDGFEEVLTEIEKVIIINGDVEKRLNELEEKYNHPDGDEFYIGASSAIDIFREELTKYGGGE